MCYALILLVTYYCESRAMTCTLVIIIAQYYCLYSVYGFIIINHRQPREHALFSPNQLGIVAH